MEFRRKHSKGPFKSEGIGLFSNSGKLLFSVCYQETYEQCEADIKAISQFENMIDYMIGRAKYHLNEILSLESCEETHYTARILTEEKSELRRVLQIIRNAGVEVVE